MPDPADWTRARDAIPDDRLRLVFTCCHPALARDGPGRADAAAASAGCRTADIARAFLVSEPTMAARITRAKKKIAPRASPTACPRPRSCPSALDAVLTVVHLLFTTGHTAPTGDRAGAR